MGHSSLMAEHCCIEVLAAKLEKGSHLPEVLKHQGQPFVSVAEKVERAFEDFE